MRMRRDALHLHDHGHTPGNKSVSAVFRNPLSNAVWRTGVDMDIVARRSSSACECHGELQLEKLIASVLAQQMALNKFVCNASGQRFVRRGQQQLLCRQSHVLCPPLGSFLQADSLRSKLEVFSAGPPEALGRLQPCAVASLAGRAPAGANCL